MFRFALLSPALALFLSPLGPPPATERPPGHVLSESTAQLSFLYLIPVEAASIPELRLALVKDAQESLAGSRKDAAARPAASRSGPDLVEEIWAVSADTPQLLAMVSTPSTVQDGAAHGHFAYRGLIWSRAGRRPLALADLFADRVAAAMLMAGLCERLRTARAQRWRDERGGRPLPMDCPRADEATVALVAGAGGPKRVAAFRMMLTGEQTPDGYAGGSYEVDVAVTPALRAQIRPDLRAAFEAAK